MVKLIISKQPFTSVTVPVKVPAGRLEIGFPLIPFYQAYVLPPAPPITSIAAIPLLSPKQFTCKMD